MVCHVEPLSPMARLQHGEHGLRDGGQPQRVVAQRVHAPAVRAEAVVAHLRSAPSRLVRVTGGSAETYSLNLAQHVHAIHQAPGAQAQIGLPLLCPSHATQLQPKSRAAEAGDRCSPWSWSWQRGGGSAWQQAPDTPDREGKGAWRTRPRKRPSAASTAAPTRRRHPAASSSGSPITARASCTSTTSPICALRHALSAAKRLIIQHVGPRQRHLDCREVSASLTDAPLAVRGRPRLLPHPRSRPGWTQQAPSPTRHGGAPGRARRAACCPRRRRPGPWRAATATPPPARAGPRTGARPRPARARPSA